MKKRRGEVARSGIYSGSGAACSSAHRRWPTTAPVLSLRQRLTRSCVSGHATSKMWTSRSYAVALNPLSRSPYHSSPFHAVIEALPPRRRIRHLCSILIQLLTSLVSPSSCAPVAPTYATSLLWSWPCTVIFLPAEQSTATTPSPWPGHPG
jgi:hypothetical protein